MAMLAGPVEIRMGGNFGRPIQYRGRNASISSIYGSSYIKNIRERTYPFGYASGDQRQNEWVCSLLSLPRGAEAEVD